MLIKAASQKKKYAHFKHYTFIFLYFERKDLKILNLELKHTILPLS